MTSPAGEVRLRRAGSRSRGTSPNWSARWSAGRASTRAASSRGRAVDALAQGTVGPVGAPVLAGGEDTGGHDDRVQVAEQRAQRVLEHQRVPRRAGRRGDQDRLAVQRARARARRRSDLNSPSRSALNTGVTAITASAADTVSTAAARSPVGKPVSRASVMRVGERTQLDDLDLGVPATVDSAAGWPRRAGRPAAGWTTARRGRR